MKQKILIPLIVVLVLLAGLYVFGRGTKKDTSMGKPTPSAEVTEAMAEPTELTEEKESTYQPSASLTLEISSPQNGGTLSSSPVTVTGKTAPNIQVFVNEKELIADGNGDFSASVELFEGENTIFIVANNNVGDYIEREITVTLESTE